MTLSYFNVILIMDRPYLVRAAVKEKKRQPRLWLLLLLCAQHEH
jgi:hypothetical protein